MTVTELQQWLCEHGQPVTVDGKGGPLTRAAILAAFTNKEAPAVTDSAIEIFAASLGCSVKQLKAVAKVESGGSAFNDAGQPKILFERHYYHRLTQGKYPGSAWNNRQPGGYNEPSWDKLCRAACEDPHAAFQSASWGRFQIMGAHWKALDYRSPIAMAHTMVQSESDHYEALVRFLTVNSLLDELRDLSTNPEDCRALARKYNGPAYERFSYHKKLAAAMA